MTTPTLTPKTSATTRTIRSAGPNPLDIGALRRARAALVSLSIDELTPQNRTAAAAPWPPEMNDLMNQVANRVAESALGQPCPTCQVAAGTDCVIDNTYPADGPIPLLHTSRTGPVIKRMLTAAGSKIAALDAAAKRMGVA